MYLLHNVRFRGKCDIFVLISLSMSSLAYDTSSIQANSFLGASANIQYLYITYSPNSYLWSHISGVGGISHTLCRQNALKRVLSNEMGNKSWEQQPKLCCGSQKDVRLERGIEHAMAQTRLPWQQLFNCNTSVLLQPGDVNTHFLLAILRSLRWEVLTARGIFVFIKRRLPFLEMIIEIQK